MSRIGKKPVPIIDGVKVVVKDRKISVDGPLGKLEFEHRPEVSVSIDEDAKQVVVSRDSDERSRRVSGSLNVTSTSLNSLSDPFVIRMQLPAKLVTVSP